MDEIISCQTCHVNVRPTDYFCYNCGRNLHSKPVELSTGIILRLLTGCFILPPMGIIWGLKYLREPNRSVRTAGIIAAIVTSIILIFITGYTISLVNDINRQINTQIRNIQGL